MYLKMIKTTASRYKYLSVTASLLTIIDEYVREWLHIGSMIFLYLWWCAESHSSSGKVDVESIEKFWMSDFFLDLILPFIWTWRCRITSEYFPTSKRWRKLQNFSGMLKVQHSPIRAHFKCSAKKVCAFWRKSSNGKRVLAFLPPAPEATKLPWEAYTTWARLYAMFKVAKSCENISKLLLERNLFLILLSWTLLK